MAFYPVSVDREDRARTLQKKITLTFFGIQSKEKEKILKLKELLAAIALKTSHSYQLRKACGFSCLSKGGGRERSFPVERASLVVISQSAMIPS